jgi:hypothetical protein
MLTLINENSNFPYNFIVWLANQSQSKYMGLFAQTKNAYEKEAIVFQTIRVIAQNHQNKLPPYSKLNLHLDSSLTQNREAFNWLVENKYLYLVEAELIDVTHLLLARLIVHFLQDMPVLPVAKEHLAIHRQQDQDI